LARESASPCQSGAFPPLRVGLLEIAALTGGRSHPKLDTSGRPIAQKYCEGKVKRTLKRGSKVLEIAKGETYVAFVRRRPTPRCPNGRRVCRSADRRHGFRRSEEGGGKVWRVRVSYSAPTYRPSSASRGAGIEVASPGRVRARRGWRPESHGPRAPPSVHAGAGPRDPTRGVDLLGVIDAGERVAMRPVL